VILVAPERATELEFHLDLRSARFKGAFISEKVLTQGDMTGFILQEILKKD